MIVKKYFINILLGFIPMLFGGFIYISFRDERILLFYWLNQLNINYSKLRQIDIGDGVIQSYIIYSLPHGLFIFSGTLIIGVIWRSCKKNFYIYTSILTIIAIIYEISQKFGIIRGTFDVTDIISIIIFSVIGFIIFEIRRKNEKH